MSNYRELQVQLGDIEDEMSEASNSGNVSLEYDLQLAAMAVRDIIEAEQCYAPYHFGWVS